MSENNWDNVNEVLDDLDGQDQSADVMDAVFEKIEQANLYQALLKQQLFDPESARPEIVEKVTIEIREFVLNRLQALVGLQSTTTFATAASPFSPEQIDALKLFADRLLSAPRSTPPAKQNSSPKTKKSIVNVQPATVRKPNIQNSVTQNPTANKTPRKRSANVSRTGQDYSQAVNPNNKPLPPPSQVQMDSQNAAIVAQQTAAMGSSDWGKILQTAVDVYQKKNANIQEE